MEFFIPKEALVKILSSYLIEKGKLVPIPEQSAWYIEIISTKKDGITVKCTTTTE